MLQSKASLREIVSGLYLMILSRYPTAQELARVAEYRRTAGVTPRETLVDLAWALVNTAEFMYRH